MQSFEKMLDRWITREPPDFASQCSECGEEIHVCSECEKEFCACQQSCELSFTVEACVDCAGIVADRIIREYRRNGRQ